MLKIKKCKTMIMPVVLYGCEVCRKLHEEGLHNWNRMRLSLGEEKMSMELRWESQQERDHLEDLVVGRRAYNIKMDFKET
jgi:hypothetical protein